MYIYHMCHIGTLLGVVRDHSILSWEFDLDLGTLQSQCELVLQSREQVEKDGYKMYGPNEWIPQKYK